MGRPRGWIAVYWPSTMTPYPGAGPFAAWARLGGVRAKLWAPDAVAPREGLVGCLELLDVDETSLCAGKSVAFSIVDGPEVEFGRDSAICTFPGLAGTVGTVQRATIATALGWYARPGREP